MSQRISDYLRSNVLGLVAIFIALGGVSWAAQNLPANSVKSSTIKNGAVRGPDIAANAITGPKVAPDSLTGADINEGSLSLPPTTAAGAAGGDLTGTYPNPTLAADSVSGAEVLANSLTGADILDSSLDFAVIQQRVGGACSPGSSIASIAENGTVTCETEPTSLPPSGPAGGDLNGSTYPNPQIAADGVGNAEIANMTRFLNLPLPAFFNCDATNVGPIDSLSGADSAPDFSAPADGRLAIAWDVTGGSQDTDPICTTLHIPNDYDEGNLDSPFFEFITTKGAAQDNDWAGGTIGNTTGSSEDTTVAAMTGGTNCDGFMFGGTGTVYRCILTPSEAFINDETVTLSVGRVGGSNEMRMLSAAFRYPARR